MLGYKVWIDKEGLLGGERFWATIQKALDCSIKVLFVYSKNIVTTEGILRQGIEIELEYAKSIAAQDGLQDFIIPLHIDNSNYHLVIGQPNINHIPFNNNWADGLKQLLKKLEKDPASSSEISTDAEWSVKSASSQRSAEEPDITIYAIPTHPVNPARCVPEGSSRRSAEPCFAVL